MLSIGMGELLIILLVGLIIFGPEKLPELARSAGRALASFQQTFEGIQQEVSEGMKETRDAAKIEMPSVDLSASESERKKEMDAREEDGQHEESSG